MSEERSGDTVEDQLERASEHVNALLESARRRIWVHTRSRLLTALPRVELAAAMSRVARRTRHADLRLLIDDDVSLKSRHPRLTHTVTRLTSAISVRCLTPAQDTPSSLLLVVDRTAWLYLVQHQGRVGVKGERRDPAGSRSAADRFAEAWAISSESLELRKLML
ncbi:hypothetical protein [Thioalkalivibrio sp.]|uniref:DUF7931 domain-containing protein n=1 Tax=Thioalkalivibrio sp. TaxID=2093813 RepID=UPI0039749B0F